MGVMRRAYSLISVKSADESARVIEGIASTPELDRQGDSMDPAGASFRLPLPLLWQHRADQPIGQVTEARVSSAGIHIRAEIAKGVLPFIDDAWKLIKSGLVRGLSIGWQPLAPPVQKNGMTVWPKWSWLELSAVTIPANQDASIQAIKSLVSVSLAASGRQAADMSRPGVSGSQERTPMNVSERLTAEKADLQTKTARLEELMAAETTDGALEATEQQERDTLAKDVPRLTKSVADLTALEAAQASLAGPIATPRAAAGPRPVAPARGVEVPARPKGQIFVRYVMAVAAGKGSVSDTTAYARRFSDTPEVMALIEAAPRMKAEPGVAILNSPSWGSQLVNPNTAMTEFIELLNPATIIGRLPLRSVPFNIPLITQTGASTFDWVGEGGVKPVGELAFDRTTLTWSKAAGIVVLTEELVRFSQPSAEATVRNDLVEQCAKFLNEQFIKASVSAGPNNPASVTNGVSAVSASGTDANAVLADLNEALGNYDSANIPTDGIYIVTTPALARGISTLKDSLGPRSFPEMTPTGGTLLGYPVIVSNTVDSGTVVLIKASEVFLADDGRVTVDASNQATLNMQTSSPSNATFSLWQNNCIGLRAERFIRWQKRRDEAVQMITGANYGPSVGSP